MSYPPQQPGGWSDPSWPEQPYQPYDPAGQQQISGQPMAPQPAGAYGYPAYPVVVARPTNGLAIASLVCSVAGLATCGITAPVGAILGHVARRQIRERGESGDGMALAGIIVGWIMTGLAAIGIAFYVVMIVVAITQADSGSSSTFEDVFLASAAVVRRLAAF